MLAELVPKQVMIVYHQTAGIFILFYASIIKTLVHSVRAVHAPLETDS